jgi:hypothetical protein
LGKERLRRSTTGLIDRYNKPSAITDAGNYFSTSEAENHEASKIAIGIHQSAK